MASIATRHQRPLHPLHAVLLGAALPLFLGAVLTDLAYASSYEPQWKNFASWLIVGALVFSGFALLWAIIELVRADRPGRRSIVYALTLLLAWILGFIDALVHAKDAWASMPDGLILSVFAAALATTAAGLGFSTLRAGGLQ